MALSFADSVKANSQKILAHINKKCYSITWQFFTSVVIFSPSPNNPGETSKGLLANQWYPSVGRNFSTGLSSSISPYGSESLSRINTIVKGEEFLGKDGVMTMTNNVSYAANAESIGWPAPQWSGRVSPYRMVALSMAKVVAENK